MMQVHIVVRNGLVQAVYTDADSDIDVTLHDLDTDNYEELLETEAFIARLVKYAKQIY